MPHSTIGGCNGLWTHMLKVRVLIDDYDDQEWYLGDDMQSDIMQLPASFVRNI